MAALSGGWHQHPQNLSGGQAVGIEALLEDLLSVMIALIGADRRIDTVSSSATARFSSSVSAECRTRGKIQLGLALRRDLCRRVQRVDGRSTCGVDDTKVISEEAQSSARAKPERRSICRPCPRRQEERRRYVSDGRDVEHLGAGLRQPYGEHRAGGMGAHVAALKRFGDAPHQHGRVAREDLHHPLLMRRYQAAVPEPDWTAVGRSPDRVSVVLARPDQQSRSVHRGRRFQGERRKCRGNGSDRRSSGHVDPQLTTSDREMKR